MASIKESTIRNNNNKHLYRVLGNILLFHVCKCLPENLSIKFDSRNLLLILLVIFKFFNFNMFIKATNCLKSINFSNLIEVLIVNLKLLFKK